MRCPYPRIISNPAYTIGSSEPRSFEVPCGHCLACRLAKRGEWVVRLLCEYQYWNYGAFIALTYAPENEPLSPTGQTTLVKKDLQDFFKRLRKYFEGVPIKYYACGEYGDNNTKRPHYHAIIFGLDFYMLRGCLTDIWGKGRCSSDPVSLDDIRYVAGYVEKKLYGAGADSEYNYLYSEPYGDDSGRARRVYDRLPPFSLCSNGIGKRYALEHREQLERDLVVKFRGKPLGFPRYFRKVLDIPKEVMFEKSKEKEFDVDYYWISKGLHDVVDIELQKKASLRQSLKNLEAKRKMYKRDKI